MSDEVVSEMLAGIEPGEDLHDPREGTKEATFEGAVPVTLENGSYKVSEAAGESIGGNYSVEMHYSGIQGDDGRIHEYRGFANIPSDVASDGSKRMFLQLLHTLELVPFLDKRARYARSQDEFLQFVGALNSLKGKSVVLKLQADKNTGFLREQLQRPKQSRRSQSVPF